jgi:hypothetical protein
MAEFVLRVEMGGDAFAGEAGPTPELLRILAAVSGRMSDWTGIVGCDLDGLYPVRDVNGNTVGEFTISGAYGAGEGSPEVAE